jgi:hypothetical protein
MTKEQLDAIRARAEATKVNTFDFYEADRTFIAHARTDIQALLAEVERLSLELINFGVEHPCYQLSKQLEKENNEYQDYIARLEAAVKLANEILTLTHNDLSNVEMNTLTTRQYMLWSRNLAVTEELAKLREGE